MTWFKVDDTFYRSGKVRKLGRLRVSAQNRVAAVGLWTLAGGWSADNLTDGFVPWEVIDEWDTDRKLASGLVKAGLWYEAERGGELGCQFHDWSDWQPTREQVIRRRKADTERKARWRDKRWSHGVTPEDDPPEPGKESHKESHKESRRDTTRDSRRESQQESTRESSLPDPTRKKTTTKEPPPLRGSPPASRGTKPNSGTRLPESFAVTDEMAAWARENTPHVDGRLEFDQFRDYWRAKSGANAVKRDWPATWRQWMRKAEQDSGRRNGARMATTDQRVMQIQALKAKFRNEPNELPWGDAS